MGSTRIFWKVWLARWVLGGGRHLQRLKSLLPSFLWVGSLPTEQAVCSLRVCFPGESSLLG